MSLVTRSGTRYSRNPTQGIASRAVRSAARYAYNNRNAIAQTLGRRARQAYNRFGNRSRSNSTVDSVSAPSAVSHAGGAGGYYVNPPARVRLRNYRGQSKGYYGKKLSRRSRRKYRRKYRAVMRCLMAHHTTPQTVKTTVAFARPGIQGQRQWMSVELAGEQYLNNLADKYKPSSFLYNTSSGSTATLQDFTKNSWHMHIDKHMWDTRIQNRSNASMELKIYECIVRHNIDAAAIDKTMTSFASIFENDTDPPATIGTNSIGPSQAPLNAVSGGKGSSEGVTHMWQHPAFTPFNSPQFCEYFKILNTYTIKLGPNEITCKKFYCKAKTFKGRWLTSGASNEWQQGWSKLLLFSWVGMPVDDGTTVNQTKAVADVFIQADVTTRLHFTPGLTKLSNFEFANATNQIVNNYWFKPTGMTAALPVDQTVQTTASASVGVTAP